MEYPRINHWYSGDGAAGVPAGVAVTGRGVGVGVCVGLGVEVGSRVGVNTWGGDVGVNSMASVPPISILVPKVAVGSVNITLAVGETTSAISPECPSPR